MNELKNSKLFAHELCEWYRANKRDLPFRHTRDPYKIFISELMLQQTQVDTVIPYYNNFVKTFPTASTLASSEESVVLKHWEGLGYYRRARYIYETAQMIVNDYAGEFPKDLKDIESLKGVGRYTARAIHSIAYNQPSAAVDGNVMRVMSRTLGYKDDIMKTKSMREIESVVSELIVHERPRDFTQAMMELGALVCQKTPKCERCPISKHCYAYNTSTQSDYPIKAKAKDKTHEHYYVFILSKGDDYYMLKRPATGLLANMYEFPQFESQSLEEARLHFETTLKQTITINKTLTPIEHVFSHKVWHMHVVLCAVDRIEKLPLYNKDTMPYAISKAHLKIFEALKKNTA